MSASNDVSALAVRIPPSAARPPGSHFFPAFHIPRTLLPVSVRPWHYPFRHENFASRYSSRCISRFSVLVLPYFRRSPRVRRSSLEHLYCSFISRFGYTASNGLPTCSPDLFQICCVTVSIFAKTHREYFVRRTIRPPAQCYQPYIESLSGKVTGRLLAGSRTACLCTMSAVSPATNGAVVI